MVSPLETTVTSLMDSGEKCTIKVVDCKIEDAGALSRYHATFCAAPSRWWNDVRFACSTIQLCESKEEAQSWHRRHSFYEGEVMSLETLWELSKVIKLSAFPSPLHPDLVADGHLRRGITTSTAIITSERPWRRRKNCLKSLAWCRGTGLLNAVESP